MKKQKIQRKYLLLIYKKYFGHLKKKDTLEIYIFEISKIFFLN